MDEFLGKIWSMEFAAALAGAFVGGLASIGGAWMQSWSADKASRETLAKASASAAYEALGTVEELMTGKSFIGAGTPEARAEWNRERTVLVIRAMGAANLLPKSQERRRTQAQKAMSLIQDWNGLTRWSDHTAITRLLVSEAREQLGTFVRGEKEPPVRDMETVVIEERMRLYRVRLISRLKELEREDAERGLDQEDTNDINQIRQELGVQHSSELPV